MSVVLNADIAPAVNAIVTIDNPPVSVTFPAAQEIIISATDDSVKIGNGSGDFANVTAASALKVDGSDVTQPVSGTVTANTGLAQPLTDTQLRASSVPVSGTLSTTQGTSPWVVSAASLPLPSGAATETKQDSGNTSLSSIDGKITAVNTGAVVVSSSALPSGAATGTKQDTGNTSLTSIDTKIPALGQALAAASIPVVLTAAQISVLTPVTAVTAILAAETTKVIGTVNISSSQTVGIVAGSAVIGHVITDSGSTTVVTGNVASTVADGADVTLGAKADAKSTATDTTAVSIMSVLKQISASAQAPPSQAVTNAGTFGVQNTPATVSTSSVTSVAGNAGNVQLLASTAGRKQAVFFNDSTSVLYLKLGTTASTSSYTVQIPSNGYYELPQPVYTGEIDGIWAVANGNARITELT